MKRLFLSIILPMAAAGFACAQLGVPDLAAAPAVPALTTPTSALPELPTNLMPQAVVAIPPRAGSRSVANPFRNPRNLKVAATIPGSWPVSRSEWNKEVSTNPDWRDVIKPNRAYLRALARPPFRMSDPAGYVQSEQVKRQQRAAAEQLRETIAQAFQSGQKVLEIPPGEYRFADNKGFVLDHYRDFTLLAYEATFWFERPQSLIAADPKGLELSHCRNVTIKGLKVDFDPPVYLQAKILEIDEEAPGYLVEIDPEFPEVPMAGGSYFLYRATGQWIRHGYLFYRETRKVEGRTYRVLLADDRVFRTHNHDENVLAYTRGQSRIGPGDYIVLPFRRGKGIYVYQCENCALEDVDEYASPGMGVLEYQGKGGNLYRRLRIIPRPGTRRLHACAADGFHNAQTDRGPQIIECEITGTSDDFFNLHGHFGVVWKKLGDREWVIGQANLAELTPGETLTFYHHLTVETLGDARIAHLTRLEDRALIDACNAVTLARHANRNYHIVTLDRAVPMAPGTLVALDRFRSGGFLIQDCYFHDAMARSLINGAGDGIITNNIIERAAWPLVIHFETWQYYEGPPPRNIRVAGNLFRGLGGPLPEGAIRVSMVPQDGGYLRPGHPLKNIQITGNYIEDPGLFAVMMSNVDTGSITDNTIVRPLGCADFQVGGVPWLQSNIGHPNYFLGKAKRAAISLWSCRNIQVRHNRIVDPENRCTYGPVQVGDYCEAIHLHDEDP